MIKTCKNPKCSNTFDARGKMKYCSRECAKKYAHGDRPSLENTATNFVAIDGEGQTGRCYECSCSQFIEVDEAEPELCKCGHRDITNDPFGGHEHKYVLLGCGDQQITNPDGLDWEECFEFLYSEFKKYHTRTAFVGFFLTYDFTMIFKTMPYGKAKQLITRAGQEQRMRHGRNPVPWPVRLIGKRGKWEVNFHSDRRLAINPMTCDCPEDYHEEGKKCGHPAIMYINDSGGTFKGAFLKVIDPKENTVQVVTPEEFAKISEGKGRRSTAILDDEMMVYNRLENLALSRVMTNLDTAFRSMGIYLTKRQWYGPGQPAGNWLGQNGAITREKAEKLIPPNLYEAARASMYGGWFEIFVHGMIPSTVYEYDLNSAYSYIISTLPCIDHKNLWVRRITKHDHLPKLKTGELCLVRAVIEGSDPYLGTLPFRNVDQSITRPYGTFGWYWQHEIEAARAAGLVDRISVLERWVYRPCGCKPPLAKMQDLYQMRLTYNPDATPEENKNSPFGKGCKVVLSSAYGKLLQSLGNAPYRNWIWASLITSLTRTKILTAIATHPLKAKGVAMVATDGVYFLTPHPTLELDRQKLGAWSETKRFDLTIYRPGIYWDRKTREAIAEGKKPQFKARGINAKAFGGCIADIDAQFSQWNSMESWPHTQFSMSFGMISAKQAIARGKWDLAGKVVRADRLSTSDPSQKRRDPYWDDEFRIWRTRPLPAYRDIEGNIAESFPYHEELSTARAEERGEIDPHAGGITPDGTRNDVEAGLFSLR